jgi:hypothetical protein
MSIWQTGGYIVAFVYGGGCALRWWRRRSACAA